MNATDRVQKELRGQVVLTQVSPIGERCMVKKNLVVDGAYMQLAYLLGYTTLAYINKVRYGSSGAAPTTADTNVTPIAGVGFLSTVNTFPTSTSVKFTAPWASAIVCATPVEEAGLFSSNGIMIARVVFAPMTKSAGWTWLLEWQLSYI